MAMAMAMASCCCFFFFLFSSSLCLSFAALLKVGDADGWTIGKIDYATWASKKTFHVGDILLFEYNKQYHNVMEVKKADFDSCSTKASIKTYATGNDSIAIETEGDHYYICGFPGHCQGGQKLKITALSKGSSAGPSSAPSMAPSAPGQSGASTGGPSASPASSGSAGGGSLSPGAASPNANDAAASLRGLGLGLAVAVAFGFMAIFN